MDSPPFRGLAAERGGVMNSLTAALCDLFGTLPEGVADPFGEMRSFFDRCEGLRGTQATVEQATALLEECRGFRGSVQAMVAATLSWFLFSVTLPSSVRPAQGSESATVGRVAMQGVTDLFRDPASETRQIPELCQMWCLTASHLLKYGRDLKPMFLEEGGLDLLESMMAMHADVSGVQQSGCELMLSLGFAARENSSAVRVCTRLSLAAIKANPQLRSVQEPAFAALQNVILGMDESLVDVAAMVIDNIQPVFLAMEIHADCPHLQTNGCAVLLGTLHCSTEASLTAVVAAGGIQRAFAAMEIIGPVVVPGEVDQLHEFGLAIACGLAHFFIRIGGDQERAVIAGGIPRLLAAMDCSPGFRRLQDSVCDALLWSLNLLGDEGTAIFMAANGHRQVCAALAVCSQEGASAALEILFLLGESEQEDAAVPTAAHMDAIMEHGGVECLYPPLDNYLAAEKVQVQGLAVLASLVDVNPAACAAIMATGGLNRVFAAMDAHPGAFGIQTAACCILGILAEDQDWRAAIVEAGGIARVTAAGTHPDEALRSVAREVLLYLNAGGDNNVVP